MLNSKTARLLAIFGRKEYPAIERFLEGTGRGPSDTVFLVFQYLCNAQRHNSKDKSLGKFISGTLGWDENDPATTTKLNFALHQLKLLLEDYLLYDFFRRKELDRETALLAAYRDRQASEFVLETSARIHKLIDPLSKGPAYYKAESEVINVQFNHPFPNQFARRKYDSHDVIQAFNRAHLSLTLVHHWNLLLQAIQFTGLDDVKRKSIQQALDALAQDPDLAADPFQTAYATAIRSVFEGVPDHATFQKIRAAALQVLDQSPPHEVMGLMNLMINYMIYLQSFSKTVYNEELLQLYQLGLENGGLFKDGYLSYGDFMNMVNISAKADRLEWAAQVIDQYGDRINPEIRDNAVLLARARIIFYQGHPEKAIQLLNSRRSALSDPDKLYEKLLRTYCYFEMNQYDLLEAHIEAFRKFILRHKNLSESIRKPVAEFLRLLRRLMTITEEEQLRALQAELTEMPGIYPFEWLDKHIRARLASLHLSS